MMLNNEEMIHTHIMLIDDQILLLYDEIIFVLW